MASTEKCSISLNYFEQSAQSIANLSQNGNIPTELSLKTKRKSDQNA
jgi:hypothetical protein